MGPRPRWSPVVAAALAAVSCASSGFRPPPPPGPPDPRPPVARIEPWQATYHGDSRTDDYHWLEDPDDPEVIAYLEAENAYTRAVMARTEPLREALFRELSARVSKDEVVLVRREGDHLYYYRWEEGRGYPVYARRRGSMEAEEQVLLDVNRLAESHAYTWVWFPAISPDQGIMAFAVDTVGIPGHATIRFRDLTTGEPLPDTIGPSGAQMAWGDDGRTLFYLALNPSGTGPALYRHVLGTDPAGDAMLVERVAPPLRKTGGYILVESEGRLLYLDADRPDGGFDTLVTVGAGEEHDVEAADGSFYIRTNAGGAPNQQLVRAPVTAPGRASWEEVVPHRAGVLLEGFAVLRDYLVWQEREAGLVTVRVRPRAGGEDHVVEFGEPVYEVHLGAGDAGSNLLRYEPAFDADLLSLVDRGFTYAIAHVRGGRELGVEWEEGGQGRNTRNRFTDFIAVAEFLVGGGYTSTDRLFAHGISSGGLLVGAVANMRPDLFRGIVAQAPWVDVVPGFMADPRPKEAGDPTDAADYRYVLSYSPYQNVGARDYPHMLVTTALRDTQVPYWLAAKWVARLRALKTDENLLLLKADLGARRHAGPTDRLERWRETAFLWAFILDLAGIREPRQRK